MNLTSKYLIQTLIPLFIGCTKEQNKNVDLKNNVIEGSLLYDCQKKGVSDFTLLLTSKTLVLDTCITDQFGNFKFVFLNGNYGSLSIKSENSLSGSGNLMTDIPSKVPLEPLNIFLEAKEIVEVHLSVNNSYTEYDTLYITNSTHGIYSGPFENGHLLTDSNYVLGINSYYGGEIRIGFKINNGPINNVILPFMNYCDSIRKINLEIN